MPRSLAPPAYAQAAAGGEPAAAKEGAGATPEAPAKKRRLKFKSDKACTCRGALGEADIEVAEKKAEAESQPRRTEK